MLCPVGTILVYPLTGTEMHTVDIDHNSLGSHQQVSCPNKVTTGYNLIS